MYCNLINTRPRVKIRVENLPAGRMIPARPRFTSVPVDALFSDITEKAVTDYITVERMRGQQDADYVLSINKSRRVDRDYDKGRFTLTIDSRQNVLTLSAHNAGRLYHPTFVWCGYDDVEEKMYYVEETAAGFSIGINSRRAREYAADFAASFTYDEAGNWNYDDERV